jgi:hypothetical protein
MNDVQVVADPLERAVRVLRTAARDARAGCTAQAILESVRDGFTDVESAKGILEKWAQRTRVRDADR